MIPAQARYVKRPVSIADIPRISDATLFVGIDLAPNDTLETGVAVIERDRYLLRMEKLNTDRDVVNFLAALGPRRNIVVALDIPKSLSVPGRWRQEEVKMHPLRLKRTDEEEPLDRHAERGWQLYDELDQLGYCVFFHFNYLAKVSYELQIPYRTRTPQGCRALQRMLEEKFTIPNMPTNLAPISVLDAMVSAYMAWTLYGGTDKRHYELYLDENHRLYGLPRCRV